MHFLDDPRQRSRPLTGLISVTNLPLHSPQLWHNLANSWAVPTVVASACPTGDPESTARRPRRKLEQNLLAIGTHGLVLLLTRRLEVWEKTSILRFEPAIGQPASAIVPTRPSNWTVLMAKYQLELKVDESSPNFSLPPQLRPSNDRDLRWLQPRQPPTTASFSWPNTPRRL